MNRAVAGFLIELCFTVPLGVYIGKFIYITPRGIAMNAAAKAKVSALGNRIGLALDWIGRGRRLAVLIVAIGFLVLGVYGYTYQSAQSADRERAAFYACVPKYVGDLSRSNLPRTIASIEASNARFYWDSGHDPKHPTWSKAQLFAEYKRLYHAYQRAIAANPPIPAFSAKYCEDPTSTAVPIPTPTQTPDVPASKHHHKKASAHGAAGSARPSTLPPQAGTKPGSPSAPRRHSHSTPRPPANGHTGSPTPGPVLPGLPGIQELVCDLLPDVCSLSRP